jgi:hypothetical protein
MYRVDSRSVLNLHSMYPIPVESRRYKREKDIFSSKKRLNQLHAHSEGFRKDICDDLCFTYFFGDYRSLPNRIYKKPNP